MEALCNLSILILVRVVPATWSLRTQLEASKPGHPYTFFSAKTAVTFIQLSDDLLKCAFNPDPLAALEAAVERKRALSAAISGRFRDQ